MISNVLARHRTLSCVLASALLVLACSPEGESQNGAPASRVALDHIPANPPGGRWMAPSDNAADYVRRFEKTGETILVGVSIERLIALAYGINRHDVVVPPAVREATFDAIVKPSPGEADRSFEMLRDMLRDDFGWITARRRVSAETMVLGPAPGAVPLEPSSSREGFLELTQGKLVARGASMADLIKLLRRDVERPIVDESRLPATYDFVLQWDPSKGAYAFLQAMGDIGLQLETGVRKVDRFFVVRTGNLQGSAHPEKQEEAEGMSDGRKAP